MKKELKNTTSYYKVNEPIYFNEMPVFRKFNGYSWTLMKNIYLTFTNEVTKEKIHSFVLRKDRHNIVYCFDKVTGKKSYEFGGKKYKVYNNLIVKEV